MRTTRTSGVVAVALALGGLVFGQWLLVFFGMLLALVYGNSIVGVCIALIADLMFGKPTGWLAHLPLPYTFLALLVVALRVGLMRQLRGQALDRL